MWDEEISTPGWEPEPNWVPLVAPGRSGARLWTTELGSREWVIKRLTRPVPGDPVALSDPHHVGYWRREADVALDATVHASPGLIAPRALRVDEDDQGVVVWHAAVPPEPTSGLFRANALGRFAGAQLSEQPWFCRDVLSTRLGSQEDRGGWRTLARTTIADVADALWCRRAHHLARLDRLPKVAAHGDATAANLRGRSGERVVALDWGAFGLAPLGSDVGYLSLSEREDFDVLAKAYAEGAQSDLDEVLTGARITAVYTALMRAELVLAKAAAAPGALAGKYSHPSVAPTLRTLQRNFAQMEALLAS